MNFRIEQEIAIFEFDDGKANALGHELIEQFFFALDEAESQAKGLLIAGREGVFSAGFDLKEINEGGSAAAKLVKKGAKLFHRMFDFPKPLVACCAGHAVAAAVMTHDDAALDVKVDDQPLSVQHDCGPRGVRR